ncbi:hypothetical protein GS491_26650 [Rhodococcus hoagii]|nr:hypothetical protein [Prescottella equi]NKR80700.1 hypothetical protein [Prescottella equi]NKS99552.1 hypothetical protein [Prescottella equi]
MSIATPYDAEVNAATQMRAMGFTDATVTAAGADGGIDVHASNAVAQVKLHGKPTGRPDLQRLYGARGGNHAKAMLFFTMAGYTTAAVEYADQVEMALFTYSLDGTIRASNRTAIGLLNQERRRAEEELKLADLEVKAAKRELAAAEAEVASVQKKWRFTVRTGYLTESYDAVIGIRFALILSGTLGYAALLFGFTGIIFGSGFWQRLFAGGVIAFAVLMFATQRHSRSELAKHRIEDAEPRIDRRGVLQFQVLAGIVAGLFLTIGCLAATLESGAALNNRVAGVGLGAFAIHLFYLAWSGIRELRALPQHAKWRDDLNEGAAKWDPDLLA